MNKTIKCILFLVFGRGERHGDRGMYPKRVYTDADRSAPIYIGAPDSARNRAARTTAGPRRVGFGAASAVKVARRRRARVYDHLRDAVNHAVIIPF